MAIILLGAGTLFAAARASRPLVLRPLARSTATPVGAREAAGAWYWLEQPQGPHARLVRVAGGRTEPVAQADAISGFSVDGSNVCWAARQGGVWSVMLGDGGRTGGAARAARTLWSGKQAAGAPLLTGGRVYWTVQSPGALGAASSAAASPALGASVQVFSAAASGGAPVALCDLLETSARVVGRSGPWLYAVGDRRAGDGNMALYRLPADQPAGPAERVAGEGTIGDAVVAPDGALYWTGLSRDASSQRAIACVRRLPAERGDSGAGVPKPETVADWLASGGRVFPGGRGVFYVDNNSPFDLWSLPGGNRLPDRIALPAGCQPLAVGSSGTLVIGPGSNTKEYALYTVAAP